MTKPIEAVVAEALQRLEASGRLDISAYMLAYPEYTEELQELLPVMLTLHKEKRWNRAASQSRSFAVGLFTQLSPSSPSTGTVGALFTREQTEAGLTIEAHATRAGLPVKAIEDLSHDTTPVTALDNVTLKQLAARVSAPFAALAKEVRRLLSLESLANNAPQMLFTRDPETSTETEQEMLREKVRETTRNPRSSKPPQEP